MPFEMKNCLKSFPMEKLCFDLKLEVLEQMEPRDVLELVKVNEGFKGMLVRDPSIVFGERVLEIVLSNEMILIHQFSNSPLVVLNVSSHASFLKKIRSCDCLSVWMNLDEGILNDQYTLLRNLKSVNDFRLEGDSREALERFFSNVHASIKKYAGLNIELGEDEDDQMINGFIENFIMSQLKDCEEFGFHCYSKDLFSFYYDVLLKTGIKKVSIRDGSANNFDWMAQQIVTNGIPSKNPEATILIYTDWMDGHPYNGMDPSQYPGIRRIDGENRLRLLKQAEDVMENLGWLVCDYNWSRYSDHYGGSDGSDGSDGSEAYGGFDMESSIYRRRIDSTKDCVYVDSYFNSSLVFLAFYVPVG